MDDKAKKRKLEVETRDNKEIELETAHPGLEDYSVQNDNFAPGENRYLNEQPGDRAEFSEELADGGERDELARRQSGNNCGGLS
ncbi:hypothetical protein GCM10007216_28340 [Thalassobacillus devorans]|uniref:DUF4025 domain-containing protein n=1 Tax=Thalassobacillus devorans TaxID=279813 RepID=A0ABQ1PF18_9BACI|nr:hypothetical protein [Thalassobacillus devorans]NIK29339.1 hypothetical protein [Thalassobacillus devorans]GGC95901.1 hypothetical protein GCM10007216_28340 [Thalassobacillus devorans]